MIYNYPRGLRNNFLILEFYRERKVEFYITSLYKFINFNQNLYKIDLFVGICKSLNEKGLENNKF